MAFALGLTASDSCGQLPQRLELKGLYPPCGSQGTTIDVVVRNPPGTWPMQIWVDQPGIEVECQEKQGQVTIHIADHAIPGTYWLRFFDATGASALLPFYVERCPQQNEAEPNDRPADGNSIEIPMAVVGRLEKRGDVDGFRVRLQAGERLTAVLLARRPLGSPMDAVLQVCDEQGRVIDQNDDERGIDPQLSFVAPKAASYLVRLFAFPETANSTIGFAGDESFIYRLELSTDTRFEATQLVASAPTRGAWLIRHHVDRQTMTLFDRDRLGVIEIEDSRISQRLLDESQAVAWADDVPSSAGNQDRGLTSIPEIVADGESIVSRELPVEAWGTISEAGEWDTYRVGLKKDERVAIRVEARSLLQQLDPMVLVFDAKGNEVGRQDDQDRNLRDLEWVFKAPADGDYELRVGDATGRAGERFAYRLQVELAKPTFALKVSNDGVFSTVGQKATIEVAVNRLNGHAQPITVSAIDLPDGVNCTSVVSTIKSDQEKKVTLEFTFDSSIVGQSIRIRGEDDQGLEALATFDVPQDHRQHSAIWLSVGESALESTDQ